MGLVTGLPAPRQMWTCSCGYQLPLQVHRPVCWSGLGSSLPARGCCCRCTRPPSPHGAHDHGGGSQGDSAGVRGCAGSCQAPPKNHTRPGGPGHGGATDGLHHRPRARRLCQWCHQGRHEGQGGGGRGDRALRGPVWSSASASSQPRPRPWPSAPQQSGPPQPRTQPRSQPQPQGTDPGSPWSQRRR